MAKGDGFSLLAIGCGAVALAIFVMMLSMAMMGGLFAGAAWLLNAFAGTHINLWTAFVVGVVVPPVVRLVLLPLLAA